MPKTMKDNLQTELNSVLVSVEDKIDKSAAQKIQQAMDRLLEQDNKFNRELLINAVDELLIIGDSKELHIEEIKKIFTFLEKLKDFLSRGLHDLYEYDNELRKEQKRVKERVENLREGRNRRMR